MSSYIVSESKSWTLYKLVFHTKNTIICLVLEVATLVWLLSQAGFPNNDMASKQPEVIEVPDDNPDDFPDSGPQNPVEAQSYRDKLDAIMNAFSDLLADDCKDALRSTVTSLKKLMVKHWWQMAETDMEVVLKSIHDPSCVYLHQHLTTEGVNVTELATEVPEGWTFLRQLPKKVQKMEVWELIVMCFNHLSEAHTHMLFAANMSSLAKITDPETFDMVMKAAAWPMIQINVLEHYLSPVQDPPLKMTAEECLSQLEKVLLPQALCLAQEPQYGPTWLLAAAIWLHLKCKFFNGGTNQGGLHYIQGLSQAAVQAVVR